MTGHDAQDWLKALQNDALRFLADAIPGPVSYLDRELRYRFVNAAYTDFLVRIGSEYRIDTIIGRTPVEAYGPEFAKPIVLNLRRAMAGERFTVELGSQSSRTLNSYIPHVLGSDVVGVLLVAQDITALHASKNAVVQAERMATLGRLVAGLLHEFNTPIGVLRSSLHTLGKGLARARTESDPERRRRQLEGLEELTATAATAVERVIAMMERLRNFARVDEAQIQQADLHEGIESVLFLLQPELGTRLTVVKDYGQLPRVECEPAAINQVLMALLSNAVRAIPDQGTIRVRTWADAEHAHVEIADDGVGIAAERLADLFNPTFSSGPRRVQSGMGLFVAHNIAEQHRGSLLVHSTLGRGSTFTLVLPIHGRESAGAAGS